MKTIDIAAILLPDLKSRMRAQDLKQYSNTFTGKGSLF
jgi:hypothetical protein